VENQKQVFHAAHEPLEIQEQDFHIPAAPATTADGKVEIQQQDSHFSTATFPVNQNQNERRSTPA
jgi:hypothetical protein